MFRKMDEMEVEINRIEHLKMVRIYDVSGAQISNESGSFTAIAVYYGDEEQMNINDLDVHFDCLLSRILDLYSREENKNSIMMDDATRQMLDNGIRARQEKMLEAFYDMTPESFPQIANESSLGRRFLPLAEYLITGFYKTLGVQMDIRKRRYGWRGTAVLWGFDGVSERQMCISTNEKHDNHYEMVVGDFLENHIPLRIEIITKKTELEILFSTADESFYGTGSYRFVDEYTCGIGNGYNQDSNNRAGERTLSNPDDVQRVDNQRCDNQTGDIHMTQRFEAYYKGQAIFFDDMECLPETVATLSENEKHLLWNLLQDDSLVRAIFKLPWNMKYVLFESESKTQETKLKRKASAYLFEDYMEQFGWAETVHLNVGTRLFIESFQLRRMKLSDGKLQTYFVPIELNSTGNYKRWLASRYFVHD